MCDDKYEPDLYGSPEEEEAWSKARRKTSQHTREECALSMADHDAGLCVGKVIWQTGEPAPWCSYCHGTDQEGHTDWCVKPTEGEIARTARIMAERILP